MSRGSSTPGCAAPCSNGSPSRTLPGAPNVCATVRPGLASSLRLCGDGHPGAAVGPSPAAPLPRPGHGGVGRHPLRLARPQNGPSRTARRRLARPGRGPRGAPRPARAGRADRASLARRGRAGLATVDGLDGAPHRSNPIVSSAPVTIWRRAVVPSMGSKRPPSWSLSAKRTGAMASGARQQRQERPRPGSGEDPDGQRDAQQREAVEQPGPPPSEPHGEGLLARLRVRRDVAQVVGLEEGGGEQTHGHARPEHEPPVVVVGEQVPAE